MVNLTHEKLTRHEKRYSEASDAQAHNLESIHERLQGVEALLKNLSRDHNTMQQTERTSPVAELAAIADDLRTICSQQIVESVVSMRTRDEMCDSSCEEDVSEVGSKDSLEGSSETRRQGSLTTRSQGTQTMLSYPNHDIITDFVDSNPTPTSSRFQLEEYSNDASAWDTDSRNECFSEIGSSSSFTTGHLDGGVDVMDQARPEDDFDQYTASNTVLKKIESSIIKECKRVVAGSFGQATRGGPEVLTMDSEEWHKGVWERFWFSKGYTIGIAFERDWGPFQSDLGLATLSNACKFHHLVRRVSFITRKLDDFHDLRRGLVRGAGAFFAWNMAEGCPYDECKRNLDLLCAESLIRVGEDSSRWESTVFCITVPWRLYRFWTSVRERSGVGCLVDQGLLAEIPIKITGRDGQTWQRLWCPETVEGVKGILAMFHEVSSSPNQQNYG
ncbi:hypothetical protein NW754_012022 [Fusarium falciforme]|nr:hypothetical protein NW754_012022 [Fusarium falciforme]